MRFNNYSNLSGTHAQLSPSNPSWINYDLDKLDSVVTSSFAARRGTQLHDLAQQLIDLKVKLPDTQATLNSYVNDCIGFGMRTEQILYYSKNCYGHADAVNFFPKQKMLRIFDLKTGVIPGKIQQLEVYASLFCLEYNMKPAEIEIELRIYQNDMVRIEEGDPLELTRIMSQIVTFDQRIDDLRMEAYG